MWWCNIWENGMDIMVSRGKDNTIETEWDVRRSIAKYLQHCLNIGFRHLKVNNNYIWVSHCHTVTLSQCDIVTVWGKGAAGYLCCSIPCVSVLVVSLHSTPLLSVSHKTVAHTEEDGLRPGRPLRLTLTDVASASSRDQSLRSPPEPVWESVLCLLWRRPESWK